MTKHPPGNRNGGPMPPPYFLILLNDEFRSCGNHTAAFFFCQSGQLGQTRPRFSALLPAPPGPGIRLRFGPAFRPRGGPGSNPVFSFEFAPVLYTVEKVFYHQFFGDIEPCVELRSEELHVPLHMIFGQLFIVIVLQDLFSHRSGLTSHKF